MERGQTKFGGMVAEQREAATQPAHMKEMQQKVGQTQRGPMERINRICSHALWKDSLARIEKLEENREFCRHDIAHFLDVARIAYIENLEKNFGISKEMIYAAALLHDIGRHLQYEKEIPHDEASVMLAREILPDCGFDQAEQIEIRNAIGSHRTFDVKNADNLQGLLYRADKKSRACLFCQAQDKCNWSSEKKNMKLFL